jgi:hypothetical protein
MSTPRDAVSAGNRLTSFVTSLHAGWGGHAAAAARPETEALTMTSDYREDRGLERTEPE